MQKKKKKKSDPSTPILKHITSIIEMRHISIKYFHKTFLPLLFSMSYKLHLKPNKIMLKG